MKYIFREQPNFCWIYFLLSILNFSPFLVSVIILYHALINKQMIWINIDVQFHGSNQSLSSKDSHIFSVRDIEKLPDIINISTNHTLTIIFSDQVTYEFNLFLLEVLTWFYVCSTSCLPFRVLFKVIFAPYQFVSSASKGPAAKLIFFFSKVLINITSDWICFEDPLIIWDWPLRGGHDSLLDGIGSRVKEHFRERGALGIGKSSRDLGNNLLHCMLINID